MVLVTDDDVDDESPNAETWDGDQSSFQGDKSTWNSDESTLSPELAGSTSDTVSNIDPAALAALQAGLAAEQEKEQEPEEAPPNEAPPNEAAPPLEVVDDPDDTPTPPTEEMQAAEETPSAALPETPAAETTAADSKPAAIAGSSSDQAASGFSIGPIGIAMIVLGLCSCCVLAALLLPASDPLPNDHQAQCNANLARIGLALKAYHNAHGMLPPAIVTDEQGAPMHSWRVYLLPFLDQENLYQQYRFDEAWNGPHNASLMKDCPSVYRCPSDEGQSGDSVYRVVMGHDTPWQANRSFPLSALSRSAEETIAVVETANLPANWLEPAELQVDDLPMINSAKRQPCVGSNHTNGAHVVMMNGVVKFLPQNTEHAVLVQMMKN